ncbi:MAG TPA: NADH-quinone oxidoreductase subunit N [Actinomycetes bacterium]|nr:NADH-quinone oxidoreductase subunit N [Actinomycetes bacterium]
MRSVVQSIDYAAIAPAVIVALTAFVVLVADLFLPPARKHLLGWLAGLGVAAALVSLLPLWDSPRRTFCLPAPNAELCSYEVTNLTLILQLLVLGGAFVVVLMSVPTIEERRLPAGEYWFLLLCSVTGAVTIAAGRDLITLVVALELVSLPAFALVAIDRSDRWASEGAMKFFLTSVVSVAVTLYGISLIYGVTGSVHLAGVSEALTDASLQPTVVSLGVVLTLVGFAFKVAAVPFHGWLPDTYVAAPIPVAAYLSVVSKAAGFAGLLLIVGLGFAPYVNIWGPVLAVFAALTMTVANLVALRQRHAVRLLAWSSIAHSGYAMVPLAAAFAPGSAELAIGDALLVTVTYLLVYGVMNLGAFAVVAVVARDRPANRLVDYRGLIRTRPWAGVALAFFLACLAGLPPGLIGLFAKVVVFGSAVDGGVGWLAVVMAINTVIALYYYLVWAAQIFAPAPAPEVAAPAAVPAGATVDAPAAASAIAGTQPAHTDTAGGASLDRESVADAGSVVDRGPVRAAGAVPVGLGLAVGLTLLAGVILSVLPQIVLQVLVNVTAGG